MSRLLSNSYRMWLARLVVVLAAVGGGLAWWALPGDDKFIETDARDQACQKAAPITDYDVRIYGEAMEDGRVTKSAEMYRFISGDSYHTYHPRQGDAEKWEKVHRDGTVYARVENGAWEWSHNRNGNPLTFPYRQRDLCLDGLEHFTYIGTETVEGKPTKKFTAPNITGEKTNILPEQGELAKEWDWVFWIDDKGYLVKVSYLFVHAPIEGQPDEVTALHAVFSGLGEPNHLPAPTATPTPVPPPNLSDLLEFMDGLNFDELPDELREVLTDELRKAGATEEQIRELVAPKE